MEDYIVIASNGKDYQQGFTRESVQMLERRGFESDAIGSKPATMIPLLVHGAFYDRHKFVRADEAWRIYEDLADRQGFLGKLTELYTSVLMDIMGGKEGETKEKNSTWEASF